MRELSIEDLLYELKRQFPIGATTFGGCVGKEAGCRGIARGCGICFVCCKEKLVRKGASAQSVDEYTLLLNEWRDLEGTTEVNRKDGIISQMRDLRSRIIADSATSANQ